VELVQRVGIEPTGLRQGAYVYEIKRINRIKGEKGGNTRSARWLKASRFLRNPRLTAAA
jgi:hypothetical protein